jgi:signal transduction histidine kinase
VSRLPRLFRNLPLAWKLLVPYLTLLVIIGAVGGYLISRQMSAQAQSSMDQQLTQRAIESRASVHDRELYLLEAGNFAANLQGLGPAVRAHNTGDTQKLLGSVAALKGDLSMAAVLDLKGNAIAGLERPSAGSRFVSSNNLNLVGSQLVAAAAADQAGKSIAGITEVDGRSVMAVATPVCVGAQACDPVGVALVAIDTSMIASDLRAQAVGAVESSIAVFDLAGHRAAKAGGLAPVGPLPRGSGALGMRRYLAGSGSSQVATLYAPFNLGVTGAGTIAVTEPTVPFFAGVQDATRRLFLLLLGAVVGIGIIGAALSALIVGQLRPLLEASRRIGRGELSARVAVPGGDELGELAAGVNQMAEQLEASYLTLESHVEERTEEVRRLMRDRTEFFAGLSHELRTPLAIIRGQAEMLKGGRASNGRAAAAASIIDTSAGQLLTVVNQILELANAEAGRLEVSLEPVDLSAIVREMTPTIKGLASGAGLESSIKVPRSAVAEADPVRVRQLVLNLVDNAVKYTPAGGRISVRLDTTEDRVSLAVEDTGVGIPADHLGRIFEPFYRVKANRTQKGQASSGLGLALVKGLVDAMGGTLSVKSEPGLGSTFTVTMKLAGVAGARRRRGAPAASVSARAQPVT